MVRRISNSSNVNEWQIIQRKQLHTFISANSRIQFTFLGQFGQIHALRTSKWITEVAEKGECVNVHIL